MVSCLQNLYQYSCSQRQSSDVWIWHILSLEGDLDCDSIASRTVSKFHSGWWFVIDPFPTQWASEAPYQASQDGFLSWDWCFLDCSECKFGKRQGRGSAGQSQDSRILAVRPSQSLATSNPSGPEKSMLGGSKLPMRGNGGGRGPRHQRMYADSPHVLSSCYEFIMVPLSFFWGIPLLKALFIFLAGRKPLFKSYIGDCTELALSNLFYRCCSAAKWSVATS